jgi:hypothetical protein
MLLLILTANRTGILKWWVDAAFAVHPNMQGHSGGGLSLGRGFPIVSLMNAEAQYPKFYGIGNCGCWQLHASDLLDLILHGSPRISSPGQCFVPEQQEYDSFGKE